MFCQLHSDVRWTAGFYSHNFNNRAGPQQAVDYFSDADGASTAPPAHASYPLQAGTKLFPFVLVRCASLAPLMFVAGEVCDFVFPMKTKLAFCKINGEEVRFETST